MNSAGQEIYLLNYSITMTAGSGNCNAFTFLYIDGAAVTSGAASLGSSNGRATISGNFAYVATPGAHTFDVRANKDCNGTVTATNRNLSVVTLNR